MPSKSCSYFVVVFVGGPAKYYKANILKTQEAITKSRLCDHLTNPEINFPKSQTLCILNQNHNNSDQCIPATGLRKGNCHYYLNYICDCCTLKTSILSFRQK